MPENWKTYKLGDIIDDIAMGPFGSNIKVDNFVSSGVPVIRGTNLNEGGFNIEGKFAFITEEKASSLKRSLAYPDDLVFTHRGTLGQVGIIPHGKYPKYLVSQSQMKLTVNRDYVVPKFLYYFFKTEKGQYELLKNKSQVGVPAIATPTKALKQIVIDLPSLEEQNKIVSILSSLDDKIEVNIKINQTLESIAEVIFKEWFIDFHFPGSNGEKKNELPEGWKLSNLVEEFYITMGQSPPGESYNENVEGTIFFQGKTDFGFRFPSTRIYTTDPKRFAEKFETLVSVRAPVGDLNMAIEKCCIGRGLGSIIHKTGSSSFTYYFIKSIQDKIKQFDLDGTVFGSITKKNFENIDIVIPSEELIMEFEKLIKPFDENIYLNTLEIMSLTRIRDLLLPKLVTGQIKVS